MFAASASAIDVANIVDVVDVANVADVVSAEVRKWLQKNYEDPQFMFAGDVILAGLTDAYLLLATERGFSLSKPQLELLGAKFELPDLSVFVKAKKKTNIVPFSEHYELQKLLVEARKAKKAAKQPRDAMSSVDRIKMLETEVGNMVHLEYPAGSLSDKKERFPVSFSAVIKLYVAIFEHNPLDETSSVKTLDKTFSPEQSVKYGCYLNFLEYAGHELQKRVLDEIAYEAAKKKKMEEDQKVGTWGGRRRRYKLG